MVDQLDPNMTWPCPRCKVAQVVTAMYCANCGLPLGAAPPGPPVVAPPLVQAVVKKKMGNGAKWLLAIVLVALTITAVAWVGSQRASPAPEAAGVATSSATGLLPTPAHAPTATEAPTPNPTPEPTLLAGCQPTDIACLEAVLCDAGAALPSGLTCPTAVPAIVLFTFKGTGNFVTKPFTIPAINDNFNVVYTYDCRKASYGQGNFIVHVVQGADEDYLINELGKKGSGTVLESAIPSGAMRFSVESGCAWTLKAIGFR